MTALFTRLVTFSHELNLQGNFTIRTPGTLFPSLPHSRCRFFRGNLAAGSGTGRGPSTRFPLAPSVITLAASFPTASYNMLIRQGRATHGATPLYRAAHSRCRFRDSFASSPRPRDSSMFPPRRV